MARLGDFLDRQGRFLLENNQRALLCIAVFALIPVTAWLSAAIVALITLRKGWGDGFKGLMVAAIALLAMSLISTTKSAAVVMAIMVFFLPCYLTAAVLHSTRSWRVTGFFIVLQALVAVVLVHWLAPEVITNQYQHIKVILKELEKESYDSSLTTLLNNQEVFNQVVIANYLMGIQSVSVVLMGLTSLLLARSVQSRLFYPGGFRQEMLTFRASSAGVALLVIAAIGAYYQVPLAITCLPVLVIYYVCAGLSLNYNIFTKGSGIISLLLLWAPLVLLPFIMVPVYAIFGVLDSLFNFRLHLPAKAGGQRK
jgi:hypothetical protein